MTVVLTDQPLPCYTPQEAFDRMVEHLARMETRAMRATNSGGLSCSYAEGCAIGALLPRDLAEAIDSRLDIDEPTAIDLILDEYPQLLDIFQVEEFPEHDVDELLHSMQAVHDEPWNWTAKGMKHLEVTVQLERIAIRHGLDHSILDRVTWRASEEV